MCGRRQNGTWRMECDAPQPTPPGHNECCLLVCCQLDTLHQRTDYMSSNHHKIGKCCTCGHGMSALICWPCTPPPGLAARLLRPPKCTGTPQTTCVSTILSFNAAAAECHPAPYCPARTISRGSAISRHDPAGTVQRPVSAAIRCWCLGRVTDSSLFVRRRTLLPWEHQVPDATVHRRVSG